MLYVFYSNVMTSRSFISCDDDDDDGDVMSDPTLNGTYVTIDVNEFVIVCVLIYSIFITHVRQRAC